MATERQKLRATAYHEAAHAVAAFRHDTRVTGLSIIAEVGTLGRCHTQTPKWFRPDIQMTPRIRLKIESEIICLFAGNLAEKKLTGRNNWRGASGDRRAAVDLASRLYWDEQVLSPFLGYVHAVAKNFVDSPRTWHDIRHVAKALLKKQKLTGREVVALIRESEDQQFEAARLKRGRNA